MRFVDLGVCGRFAEKVCFFRLGRTAPWTRRWPTESFPRRGSPNLWTLPMTAFRVNPQPSRMAIMLQLYPWKSSFLSLVSWSWLQPAIVAPLR